MNRPRLRPHFERRIDAPADAVVSRLRAALVEGSAPFEGRVSRRHAQLQPIAAARHSWSPWLSFEIEEREAGTHLRGRFSPHPNVWTLFLALQSAGALLAVGAGILAAAQAALAQPVSGLWLAAAGLLLGAGATLVAWLGPGLAAEEMMAMARFVERAAEGSLEGRDP